MSLVPDGSWRRIATVLSGVSAVLLCAATFASPAQAISGILGTTNGLPRGIAVDSAGNIYTANSTSDDVTKITPSGTSSLLTLAGGTDPGGITVDSAGNVYTANFSSNNVTKITPSGTSSLLTLAGGTRPTGITVDSYGNLYTANRDSANVSKITPTVTNGLPDIFPAPPERPSAPTAAVGSPGSGTATVTVAANPISAAFGVPSSYTISATQDASKQCIVTSPTTSCSVTGLTVATAYTFTARANLNSWQTAASAASNSVTPAAAVPDPTPTPNPTPTPKPAKPAVTWSSSAKAKTITAVITPVAGVTYTLTAKSGRKTKKGSCKNVTIKKGKKKVARRSCTVKLAKGKWLATVTPKKGSISGTVNSKSYSFK
ncbi:MAG: hypothetical protein JHD03_01950 [Solirubrobacteraceae bacterium]|nr:hypothetical protein [Solirubrobacteraceae bacterium]